MILVTGGCRSGKSEFAEKIVTDKSDGPWLYIATAKITDEEMETRVLKHRARRSSQWDTYEEDGNIVQFIGSDHIKKYNGILMDSITTFVTNRIFDEIGEVDWSQFSFESVDFESIENSILKEFERICVEGQQLPIVFVTDEIGLGVVPETCLGRNFRDILGRVNQYIAGVCEDVYMVISGIPVKIKGKGVSNYQ